jgi:thiol peroxidase
MMALRILIGIGLGLAAGGLIGYIGKCRSGTCPLTGNPFTGALFGAAIGGLLAWTSAPKGEDLPESEHVVHVTGIEQFEQQVTESDTPVLVDFYADWCGPCKVLAPRINRIAEDYAGRAKVVKVDVDDAQALAREYGIQNLPTVMLFAGDAEPRYWLGAKDERVYRAALDEALAEAGPAGAPRTRTNHDGNGAADAARQRKEGTMDRQITFKGNPLHLEGEPVEVGQKAPEFTAVGNDLAPVNLSDHKGKTLIIASVPSLDTGVCSMETKRFNEEAGKLGDVDVLVVSMDLPFAQKRWCGAEGVENVATVSDYRDAEFGRNYGVLIKELRLLARAVFVVDSDGVIRYIQLVPEMAEEPDYDAVLAAVRDVEG